MVTLGPFLGINNKFSESYIKDGYGSYSLDVDYARRTIKPMRTDRKISDKVGNTVYLEDCCLQTYDKCVNIVRDTMVKTRYVVDGIESYPQTASADGKCGDWCSQDLAKLGFPCMGSPLDVMYSQPAGNDRNRETRKYTYTYVNCFKEESIFAPPSDLEHVHFQSSATMSGFEQPPPEYGITHYNIYMLKPTADPNGAPTKDTDGAWLLVGTTPVGTISYTHDAASVTGEVVDDELLSTFVSVPEDAHSFAWYGENQMAFISNDYIRFTGISQDGLPNYSVAPIKYAYEPRTKPLKFVATENFGYVLTCSKPEIITLQKDCNMTGTHNSVIHQQFLPLIGIRSVATHNDGVVYASTEGIVYVTRQSYVLTTKDIFTREQYDELQPQTFQGVVWNGYYYCSNGEKSFRIMLPNGLLDDYSEGFSWLSIKADAWYVTSDNRLIYTDATGTHEVEQGDGFKPYKYVSKTYFSGRPTSFTAWRHFGENGKVKLTHTIDGLSSVLYDDSVEKTNKIITRGIRIRGYEHVITIEGDAEIHRYQAGESALDLRGQNDI
jgi:hypothetical protein